MKKTILTAILASTFAFSLPLMAEDKPEYNYVIDTEGAHAFIQFRVNHLGFSWLRGRFDNFTGAFYYNPENPEISHLKVNIDTTSINSNHKERDKHLKNEDFLEVETYPDAKYVGTYYQPTGDNTGIMHGDLTLRGITNHVMINVEKIGIGEDPWGNERVGFTGTTQFELADFGIDYDLGEAATTVYLDLDIEGIKQ